MAPHKKTNGSSSQKSSTKKARAAYSKSSSKMVQRSPEPETPHIPWRYLTVSLIRNAECESDAGERLRYDDDGDDPLTSAGREQAESLGTKWADVPIAAIYTSPHERAHDTAEALAKPNVSKPKVLPREMLVERKYGETAWKYLRNGNELEQRTKFGDRGPADRTYAPPHGGESRREVGRRALAAVKSLFYCHGVGPENVPKKYRAEGKTRHWLKRNANCKPDSLPSVRIPHVVIISDQCFLKEFYEMLLEVQDPDEEHWVTATDYDNVAWSRHFIRLREVESGLELDACNWNAPPGSSKKWKYRHSDLPDFYPSSKLAFKLQSWARA
ncbi:hypothetical protein EW146_g825 [Bondarzewia mesenterica]|uniref:Uncharacterized protein n=1 Tax=Bondarzewia mesenterica TaxID=1095465 RepID=A0A4S4M7K9_9AGAM|nr:hypothetical protein EW146_g825 [Bondarzewia mesenterica]